MCEPDTNDPWRGTASLRSAGRSPSAGANDVSGSASRPTPRSRAGMPRGWTRGGREVHAGLTAPFGDWMEGRQRGRGGPQRYPSAPAWPLQSDTVAGRVPEWEQHTPVTAMLRLGCAIQNRQAPNPAQPLSEKMCETRTTPAFRLQPGRIPTFGLPEIRTALTRKHSPGNRLGIPTARHQLDSETRNLHFRCKLYSGSAEFAFIGLLIAFSTFENVLLQAFAATSPQPGSSRSEQTATKVGNSS